MSARESTTGPAGAKCPDCGQTLPGGRLGALCPQCLLQLAGVGSEVGEEGETSGREARALESFGDYEIHEEIARGGMGIVFRAYQRSLAREVALKMVRGTSVADAETQRRFQREAHAAASLHHPHIVPVYEIGEHRLQPYFTMRLVPGGETIAQWAARHREDQKALAAAAAQVARAVSHAHERGVLHRDLKPSNVLWDPQAGPQVTDFGLAKWIDDPLSSLSRTGEIVGSPSYMSPEQASGKASEVTTASDVYGLGALLYELLTGDPPFRAATSMETLERARTEPPERPSRRQSHVDRDLETICLKCLEKAPQHRYGSARELAEELERYVRGEPIRARRISAAAQLWRWARRNPSLAASLAGVLAVLVGGLLGIAWQWRKAEQARAGERRERSAAQAGLADQLARNGFAAAKEGDPSRAALWFAQAATVSDEPMRQAANRLRWRTWRETAPTPTHAFSVPFRTFHRLIWHPEQRHLLVQSNVPFETSIWDLTTQARWRPDLPLGVARWFPRGDRLLCWHAGMLSLREFPSGNELWRMAVPEPEVFQLEISPDLRWLALGSLQPRLYDLQERRMHDLPRVPDRQLAPETDLRLGLPDMPGLVLLEFSADSRHVLLSGRGWRGTCALAALDKFAAEPVDCLSVNEYGFLGEGARFVVMPRLTQLRTLDSASGQVLHSSEITAPGHIRVNRAADRPSPDGRFLIRAGSSIVDIATGQPLPYPVHANATASSEFSADGSLLVTASIDDTVRLWRVADGSGTLVGWHQEPAYAALSPRQDLVASVQVASGLVRIWQLPAEVSRRVLPLPAPAVLNVSHDEQWLLPSSWTDHEASLQLTRAYRLDTLETGPELAPGGIVLAAALAPDSAWAVLAVSDAPTAVRRVQIESGLNGSGALQFWDFRRGQQVGTPLQLPVEPLAVAVHPNGQRLAVAGAGRSLYEYERATGELRELIAPGRFTGSLLEGASTRCSYSPDGSTLVATGRGLSPYVFRSGTRERLAPHLRDQPIWSSAFHGSVLATGSGLGKVEFTRVPEGTRIVDRVDDANWLFFSAFDARGELFLTGGRSRAARVYDWRRRQLAGPALLHSGELCGASFVPGTAAVATAENSSGSVYFWDPRLGQQLRPPVRVGSLVDDVRALRDGKLLTIRFGEPPSIVVFDGRALLAPPQESTAEALALAELEAAATIQNGAIEPINAEEWLRRWRARPQRSSNTEPRGP